MKRDKVEKMLLNLGGATEEVVRAELAEKVKAEIPGDLRPHRGGMDSVNIIIDLRVSRVAAAAVIVGATVLFATFFSSRDPEAGFYKDSKAIIKYLSQARRGPGEAGDREFVIYGESTGLGDSNDLLMHWKVGEGKYRVMFCDKRMEMVDSEELIKLQAGMIRRITKD